ncbi:MAG TPA: PIN domain-containing protein [Desulfatiglandales bacterium]|nr:PIN domain-containing protein [Desulfatiglandales bacterium]
MKGILIDSNVILDLFENNQNWAEWSESSLEQYSMTHTLYINPIIYAEVSIGFERIEELENAITGCGFQMIQIPKEALFLAGKAFIKHKKQKGSKLSPLPDFFIGAHAAVVGLEIMTRDISRFRSYFPTVKLVTPDIL